MSMNASSSSASFASAAPQTSAVGVSSPLSVATLPGGIQPHFNMPQLVPWGTQPQHPAPMHHWSPYMPPQSFPGAFHGARHPAQSPRSGVSSLATQNITLAELPPGIDTRVPSHDNSSYTPWTAHKMENGIVYYFNAATGVSTYEKPPGFQAEPEMVASRPTPVSMENVAGTDWAVVTTNDGKTYYYNTITKLSSWQIPSEVAEFRRRQEGEAAKSAEPLCSSIDAPAATSGGREAVRSSTPGSSSTSALDLIKKKLQDASSSLVTSSMATIGSESNGSKANNDENAKDKSKEANEDGNVSESSDSEKEENNPIDEVLILQFKEMLKERGVAPFSKWDKELPKFVFDPRFKAIPSHSVRRTLFDRFVKTRAEEERKEKRAAQKAALDAFKQLLDEASGEIDSTTDYHTFRRKHSRDSRFEALNRKDREILLNERTSQLKKAAEEKHKAEVTATVNKFKSMLRDHKYITINSRWSRVKDSLRDDPRYKCVRYEEREILFEEYLLELKAAEEEAAKNRRNEEEKLKERERELRKRKEREEQELERVRAKVRRKEALSSFQALLVEAIRDPQATWTESKVKLEKDPLGRGTNPDLDGNDAERLFRDHVKTLNERCASEYRSLMVECLTEESKGEDGRTIFESWSAAKELLKSDNRFNKMPRKDRESHWRKYVEELASKDGQVIKK